MYFDDSDVSITAWELLCVELVDYVCMRAYMEIDLISRSYDGLKVDIY